MKPKIFILSIYLILANIIYAFKTNISADARLKVENFHNDTVSTYSTASYFRARLNFDLTSEIYKIYFQFQDSRILGDQENSPGFSSANNSPANFHQVYAELNGAFGGKNNIRFGRFEMPLGKQRLFGRSGWDNYGRSFEGVSSNQKTNRGNIHFFHLINSELYEMNDQFDYTIDGFYGSTKIGIVKKTSKQTIESENKTLKQNPFYIDYYLYNENIVLTPEANKKQRKTLGFRVNKNFKNFSLESEFAYQSGTYYSEDIEATLSSINIEIPIIFTSYVNSISFSKEYLSGDEYLLGGSDGVLSGFAKPFGSGHGYHGYYDNPLHKKYLNNSHQGLSEWFVKTSHTLFSNTDVSIKYHDFKDAIDSVEYGRELDFIFSRNLPFGGKIIQGFSIYYPEDGDRLEAGYLMILINI